MSDSSRWVIYCDESREGFVDRTGYLGIGGLWVRSEDRDPVKRELRAIARSHGLNAELKWQKVSTRTLEGYSAFAEAFARMPLYCRVLLVEKATVDLDAFHGGDADLGFYKFYFRMLDKWIQPANRYTVLLDHKPTRTDGHHTQLRSVLGNAIGSHDAISQLTFVDSRESHLSQLVDVLTGAITAAWTGTRPGTAKALLQERIARSLGLRTLRFASVSPGFCKLNVFCMNLRGRVTQPQSPNTGGAR